jgi:hypothetical protein
MQPRLHPSQSRNFLAQYGAIAFAPFGQQQSFSFSRYVFEIALNLYAHVEKTRAKGLNRVSSA